jgi:hypothetical protein
MHWRVALFFLLAGVCAAGHADPPVAQYAGAQLRMAESALELARAALRAHDYARVRALAAQAGLDARLAWGMSASAALRRSAAEVHREAEGLRWRSLVAAGAPPRTP